jgi:hypothetical protein
LEILEGYGFSEEMDFSLKRLNGFIGCIRGSLNWNGNIIKKEANDGVSCLYDAIKGCCDDYKFLINEAFKYKESKDCLEEMSRFFIAFCNFLKESKYYYDEFFGNHFVRKYIDIGDFLYNETSIDIKDFYKNTLIKDFDLEPHYSFNVFMSKVHWDLYQEEFIGEFILRKMLFKMKSKEFEVFSKMMFYYLEEYSDFKKEIKELKDLGILEENFYK